MTRVALIGTGRMGSGMAGRLLSAGYDLTVTSRTRSKAEPLLTAGAHWADTPASAVGGAEAVLVMVGDDEASRAVWLGPDGVLVGSPAPGALAIECSTLSHGWALELAGRCTEAGLGYLDSPVTGLPEAAAAGKLTLLVGAVDADLAAAEPFLTPISERVIHFGGVGAGTAYKLVVNLIGAIQIASAAEGLALAEKAGLNPDQVVEALGLGQAASPQVVRNTLRMALGDHDDPVVFSGRLRRKDAAYALDLATELGLAAPFGQVALNGLDRLIADGRGDVNESAIIEVAWQR